MKTVVSVKTLNTKAIDRAIRELQGRKRMTPKRVAIICEVLSKRGEQIAKQKIAQYTHGTGNLANNVIVWTEHIGGQFKTYIALDTPYAAYVEFGTGIVGAVMPHPNASRRHWAYDVNNHGLEGWVYPKDDEFFHTIGEPAKPIMWETLQQLKQELPIIVREVFALG